MGEKLKGRQRWPGGYVHAQADDRELFIIERQVRDKRFHISTRTHSLRAAMKQLERFEADPNNYSPEGVEPEEPLYLDAELADAFWEWQVEVKGVTTKHANAVGNRLEAWIEDLGSIDLRKVSLRDHIKPALDRRGTQRAHRISTIKAFFGWLRKERHLLVHEQDATLDIAVPQAQPEKRKRKKAVEIRRVRAVLKHLKQPYRDCLVVMGATGWHFTELERFIRQEGSEIVRQRRGKTIAVLVTLHKNRELTRTPVTDPEVLAAAQRRKAHGRVPKRCNAALKEACKKAGVTEFTFGVMRHTVGTWGVEGGASKEDVSALLAHKDSRTADRFYIDVHVPTTAVKLPRLRAKG